MLEHRVTLFRALDSLRSLRSGVVRRPLVRDEALTTPMNRYSAALPAYPTSWYRVAESRELAAGKILTRKLFGSDRILYRTESGRAVMADAHCPHLGAHLGRGHIEGESVVCPFHAWKFDAEGACREVPYCDKLPKKATLSTWRLVEQNGSVFAWYAADTRGPSAVKRETDSDEPWFALPDFEEFRSEAWMRPLCLQYRIRVHPQDIMENAFDFGHFTSVHTFIERPTLRAFDVDAHNISMRIGSTRKTLGIKNNVELLIRYHGLGFAESEAESGLVGVKVMVTATPIDNEWVDFQIKYSFRKTKSALFNAVLALRLPHELGSDFELDVPIWETKIYREKPILCAEDGPVVKARRWASQFYPEQGGKKSALPPVLRSA